MKRIAGFAFIITALCCREYSGGRSLSSARNACSFSPPSTVLARTAISVTRVLIFLTWTLLCVERESFHCDEPSTRLVVVIVWNANSTSYNERLYDATNTLHRAPAAIELGFGDPGGWSGGVDPCRQPLAALPCKCVHLRPTFRVLCQFAVNPSGIPPKKKYSSAVGRMKCTEKERNYQ